ncbi:HmuY family protein [Bacteroidia bacterium]|nr:HmuY family protein [Bacteroidia bacterium]
MKRFISFTFLISFLLIHLVSCHKEEELYPAPQVAEGLQTQTFEMGENYSNQLFFDFESQQTATNEYGLWDIGLSCDGIPHAIICAGKNTNYSVARISDIPIENVKDINFKSLNWKYDDPKGNIDSNALSGCFTKVDLGYEGNPNEVFIIDLGSDSSIENRYIKLQFISAIGGNYQFKWGYVFDSIIQPVILKTNESRNYVYYSFGKETEVENEPVDNKNWDVVFTTYKDAIPDKNGVIYPYIIRGVLINPKKVEVAEVGDVIQFNDLTYADAIQNTYSKTLNEIGYDWKEYDQDASKYTIVPNKYYLLKTNKENYFKLRFVDFYDDQGRKGFPKMAWKLLNP